MRQSLSLSLNILYYIYTYMYTILFCYSYSADHSWGNQSCTQSHLSSCSPLQGHVGGQQPLRLRWPKQKFPPKGLQHWILHIHVQWNDELNFAHDLRCTCCSKTLIAQPVHHESSWIVRWYSSSIAPSHSWRQKHTYYCNVLTHEIINNKT